MKHNSPHTQQINFQPPAGRGCRAADPPTLRHKCGTSAAQVRHKCGTSAAQVRHKCGTSAEQVRHKCGASAEQVRSKCGASAEHSADRVRNAGGCAARRLLAKTPPKKHKNTPKSTKTPKKTEKNTQFFFAFRAVCGYPCGSAAERRRHRCGTGAAPVRHRCGSRAERRRNGGGTAAERRRNGGGTAAEHGTRFEIFFAGYGYVTTQDGTSRPESSGLRRLEIERSAHGHCSAPSHPCRALG